MYGTSIVNFDNVSPFILLRLQFVDTLFIVRWAHAIIQRYF